MPRFIDLVEAGMKRHETVKARKEFSGISVDDAAQKLLDALLREDISRMTSRMLILNPESSRLMRSMSLVYPNIEATVLHRAENQARALFEAGRTEDAGMLLKVVLIEAALLKEDIGDRVKNMYFEVKKRHIGELADRGSEGEEIKQQISEVAVFAAIWGYPKVQAYFNEWHLLIFGERRKPEPIEGASINLTPIRDALGGKDAALTEALRTAQDVIDTARMTTDISSKMD